MSLLIDLIKHGRFDANKNFFVLKRRSELATLSQIEALLKEPDTDVNATDEDGLTALHYAVACHRSSFKAKRIDVVKMFLQYGADPNAASAVNDERVLDCCQSIDIMKLLIMSGVDPGGFLLHRNAYSCMPGLKLLSATRLLVAAGVDVNYVPVVEGNVSCLYRYLQFAKYRSASALIAGGATIDARVRKLLARKNIEPPSEKMIEHEKAIVATIRWRLVLPRVFEICVALHELQISVLEICLVLEYAVPVFCLVPSHVQWHMVKSIRHATSQSISARTAECAEFENKKKRKVVLNKRAKRIRL